LPGGFPLGLAAGGFAPEPTGLGVVAGEGSAGPSVSVTGFLPGGGSFEAGGGREPGLDVGVELRPAPAACGGGRSEAGVEAGVEAGLP
jgi:hypothetical protein